jgi:glycosyltransferase involved in cell wall biosynthesis
VLLGNDLNILIVTPHFYPENFRINDFAEAFTKRGHEISVLTGVPDYPEGKFYDGYGLFKKNREIYNGIKIYRAPLIPRGSGSNIRLALNYISFIFGALFTSLFMMKNEFDIVFVFEPSPITVGIPAIFIKKIKKIPLCFWVLDLWPESVVSAGNLKSSFIPRILNPIVKYIYKHSDRILVSSNGFIHSIVYKGINKDKIEFFPQWAEPIFKPMKSKKFLLTGVPEKSFKIMFAGNIGEAQDFPSIIEAARQLRHNQDIQWVVLGGGRREEWVKSKIKEYDLENSFHLLGSFPLEKMPEFYANADAMLFSLKDEYIFSITIPAKVQSYLACGKPILAMVNGEGGKVVVDAKAGFSCAAESPHELVQNILKMKTMREKDLSEMGENARKYYDDNFERSYLFDKAENIFRTMCESF